MKPFAYLKAKTPAEALAALNSKGARIHAGGTDLLGCLHDHLFTVDKVVSISGIKEWSGMTGRPDGGLKIGCLTTIASIAASAVLKEKYAVLAQAASEVASPQLREQGTIGGNLCQRPRCWYYRGDFPCARKGGETCFAVEGENQNHAIFSNGPCFFVHPSDTAVALSALQARLTVAGPAGTRTVPIESFFLAPEKAIDRENVLEPAEILTEIHLPAPAAGARSSYRKIRSRQSWDFALTSVALWLQVDKGMVSQARCWLGGVAPAPWRAAAAEKLLAGKKLNAALAASAGQAAAEGAVPMRDNAYKVEMVKGAVEESLLRLLA